MSIPWPSAMLEFWVFVFVVEMPRDYDLKKLFEATRKIVEKRGYLEILGDEKHATIVPRFHKPHVVGMGAHFIDSEQIRFEYAIDKQSISISIHKKLGPIVGIVEQHFIKMDMRWIRQIFFDAMKAVEGV